MLKLLEVFVTLVVEPALRWCGNEYIRRGQCQSQ